MAGGVWGGWEGGGRCPGVECLKDLKRPIQESKGIL